jgi:hypothetical protein
MYEYGKLKPVEVILRRGGSRRRIMGGMKQPEVQYMDIWKFYNEIP